MRARFPSKIVGLFGMTLACGVGTSSCAGAQPPVASPSGQATASQETPASQAGQLSLDALAGREWVLRSWRLDERAQTEVNVTLRVQSGIFTGSSGCNTYRAGVTPGTTPGDVKIGPAISTRMACPEPAMSVESRYLRLLQAVTRFGFAGSQLALTYQEDGKAGAMLFDALPVGAGARGK